MSVNAHDNRSSPARFREKLGNYLTGVAIGFMFLGVVYYLKAKAVERERAEQQMQQQQQETGGEQTGARP